MFDVNRAIDLWRSRMADRRVSDPDDLDEMEQHLRDAIEQHMEEGMTAEAAFQTAAKRFGEGEAIRREFESADGPKHYVTQSLMAPMLLGNYVKVAFRNIARYKGYAAINVLGLAIGIACCLLILLYIRDEYRYDRHFADADRIFRMVLEVQTSDGQIVNTARTPPPWASVLAGDFPEIEDYVRFRTPDVSWLITYLPEDREFQEKRFYLADETVFNFLGLPLIQGDPATALAEPHTVVISETAAKKYFGDEDPMGKVIRADNTFDFRITGVMKDVPERSHITFDFLASIASINANDSQGMYGSNGSIPDFDYFDMNMSGLSYQLYSYIKLAPGISADEVQNKLSIFIEQYLGNRLRQNNMTYTPSLQALTDIHLHSQLQDEIRVNSDIAYVYIFAAVAFFILLIACINFMNLTTARSASRAQEVGMRKAVGAGRTHLISQFLGETVVMAFLALVASVGLAQLLLPVFSELSGKTLALSFGLGWILLGGAGIVFIVGIIAGSYPAFVLSSFQPARVLKGSIRSLSTNAGLRKTLVVLQFTISIIFIIGTGIVIRQMQYVQNKRLGFDKEHVVTIPLSDHDSRLNYQALKNALLRGSDILAVAGTRAIPGGLISTISIRPEGTSNDQAVRMNNIMADLDLVPSLGAELVAGRNFSVTFPTDTMQAVILNEAAVKQMGWENDPIDKEVVLWQNWKHARIIGVVKDFHFKSLHAPIEPLVLHMSQGPGNMYYILIRINGAGTEGAVDHIEQAWQEVFPNDPLNFSFLNDDLNNLYRAEQARGRVFGAFAVLAIVIACLGLFGLASFTAETRTREIGIRKVLGASIPSVMHLLSREFVTLIIWANLLAWPVAYIMMDNWLNNFAYSVSLEWFIFLAAGIMAIAIALLTVSYHAVRTALANPVASLRYE